MAASRLVRALATGLCSAALLAPPAARSIETIRLRLPLLEADFLIRVSELRSPAALLAGDSDLAELDRATNGVIGQKLKAVLQSNLPLELKAVLLNANGSPLLEQVLLLVGALGDIDGLPEPIEPAQFHRALELAAAKGGISLLDVLENLPGESVTVELGRLGYSVQRFRAQRRQAEQLIAALPAASSKGRWLEAGKFASARRELKIDVAHRPEPLALVIWESSSSATTAATTATATATDRLVVISHGLWDDPRNFEGWAGHLASHGYTVVLPRHPGSDQSQQRAMLSGKQPPPKPAELALRPKDVSAVIDAAAQGQLNLRRPVNTKAVLVAGHSWGGDDSPAVGWCPAHRQQAGAAVRRPAPPLAQSQLGVAVQLCGFGRQCSPGRSPGGCCRGGESTDAAVVRSRFGQGDGGRRAGGEWRQRLGCTAGPGSDRADGQGYPCHQ